jgi:hypothetical protein
MKMKHVFIAAVGLSLLGSSAVRADDPATTPPTTPPVVVSRDRDERALARDLKNAPAEVKQLILDFDQTRDKYLADQRALLQQLRDATDEQRTAIRAELQANRGAFLAELKTFRQTLRQDLTDLKGKIGPGSVKRIVDAAKDASKVPHPRKGKE